MYYIYTCVCRIHKIYTCMNVCMYVCMYIPSCMWRWTVSSTATLADDASRASDNASRRSGRHLRHAQQRRRSQTPVLALPPRHASSAAAPLADHSEHKRSSTYRQSSAAAARAAGSRWVRRRTYITRYSRGQSHAAYSTDTHLFQPAASAAAATCGQQRQQRV